MFTFIVAKTGDQVRPAALIILLCLIQGSERSRTRNKKHAGQNIIHQFLQIKNTVRWDIFLNLESQRRTGFLGLSSKQVSTMLTHYVLQYQSGGGVKVMLCLHLSLTPFQNLRHFLRNLSWLYYSCFRSIFAQIPNKPFFDFWPAVVEKLSRFNILKC